MYIGGAKKKVLPKSGLFYALCIGVQGRGVIICVFIHYYH